LVSFWEDIVPGKKLKIDLPGIGLTDAVEVSVMESTERWSEVKLDDGTVLRLKPVVLAAVRVEGHYDPEGNPMYSLRVNQIMTVSSAPDHLRKGGSVAPKGVQ
jgi:hypothetical protein